jgi:hypothetical protein
VFDCCDQLAEIGRCILNCPLKVSFTETSTVEQTVLCNAHPAIFFLIIMCMKPKCIFVLQSSVETLTKYSGFFGLHIMSTIDVVNAMAAIDRGCHSHIFGREFCKRGCDGTVSIAC